MAGVKEAPGRSQTKRSAPGVATRRSFALVRAVLKLAFSLLCEHPSRKTGLTTLFHEFVSHALKLYPEIDWIVFAGSGQEWTVDSPRVQVVRRYPANDCARIIS